MEDYANIVNSSLYSSFFEINDTRQNNFSDDSFENYLDTYGQKLKNIASMLLRSDLYTLGKNDETFTTIIKGIKDVIENFTEIDGNSMIENILDALYAILNCLHIAGDRAGEADFEVRKVKYSEFSQCYRDLMRMAKQLCKKML